MRSGLAPSGANRASHKPGAIVDKCGSIIPSRREPAEAFPFDPQELRQLVWEMSVGRIAAAYGIPEKTIEKCCRALGIKLPPHGYWQKLERVSKKVEET